MGSNTRCGTDPSRQVSIDDGSQFRISKLQNTAARKPPKKEKIVSRLTRILLRFKQISLMLTSGSNVAQPRRKKRRSGNGSAMATLMKPGNLLQTYAERNNWKRIKKELSWLFLLTFSTSLLVMLGGRLRKKIEVVLWNTFRCFVGDAGFGVSPAFSPSPAEVTFSALLSPFSVSIFSSLILRRKKFAMTKLQPIS